MGAVQIVGGGLAGVEAAWYLARAGIAVTLHEMRPLVATPAHHTALLGELVCSNSLRSDDALTNAVGVLHAELRACGSLVMAAADQNRVPAGGALAVDREGFARTITQSIEARPEITVVRSEVTHLPEAPNLAIIATGPLTSNALATAIQQATGQENLAFFDAIAPILYKDSIDFDQVWRQSRYDKGGPGGDYLNCPLDEAQYAAFVESLLAGEKTEFREWERSTPYFDGCLPIEVMAARGPDTLRWGPMKPVGLTNPKTGVRPYATVQLRQDNALDTLYNMVGFQTKLKYGEQQRIFRMIPGLAQAEFARLGGLHRNSFINAPRVLAADLHLKSAPHLRFAGQIIGVEGYVESAAMGWLAGCFTAAEYCGISAPLPPATTALGALLRHVTTHADAAHFQPMNINFGLFPPLADDGLRHGLRGRARKGTLARRAGTDLAAWLGLLPSVPKNKGF